MFIAAICCAGTARSAAITTFIGTFDSTATWILRESPSPGLPDNTFAYGVGTWKPVTGDWTGSGHDGIGVFDPSTATFFLRNEASAGPPDAGIFTFGAPGWTPVTGDWTGSGGDRIGVFDRSTATWFLRNELSPGPPDAG